MFNFELICKIGVLFFKEHHELLLVPIKSKTRSFFFLQKKLKYSNQLNRYKSQSEKQK